MEKLDILLVSENEGVTNQILNSLERDEVSITVIRSEDVSREVNRQMRHIVIFVHSDNEYVVEHIQYVKNISSQSLVIYLSQETDISTLRNITRAGAEEFFILPDELSLFISRMPTIIKNYQIKIQSEQNETMIFGKSNGSIYSFYSGKGGSGKSLLASTFAQTVKLESVAEVILIDFDIQYGGIETIMSIDSNRSLLDLKPVIQELNESHIRNVSQTEQYSNLEVLISPRDAEATDYLDDQFISRLLRTCRRSFDLCVIDLPSQINSLVATALEESDYIYYVLSPETPSLKVLKHYEELCERLGINLESNMEIIINQVSKANELKIKDLKELMRFPVVATIRKDYKGLQSFINKGEPIRKKQKEKLIPFARDVRKFSRAVLK
ncbi:AAA family ATPase [Alkalibacillus silvisoli]|uniref:AAA domain-containing protein n=1 Tax=Alkalibacillus silvisoli TaxID=392823 RepID=A0ABN1A233_9BACI